MFYVCRITQEVDEKVKETCRSSILAKQMKSLLDKLSYALCPRPRSTEDLFLTSISVPMGSEFFCRNIQIVTYILPLPNKCRTSLVIKGQI